MKGQKKQNQKQKRGATTPPAGKKKAKKVKTDKKKKAVGPTQPSVLDLFFASTNNATLVDNATASTAAVAATKSSSVLSGVDGVDGVAGVAAGAKSSGVAAGAKSLTTSSSSKALESTSFHVAKKSSTQPLATLSSWLTTKPSTQSSIKPSIKTSIKPSIKPSTTNKVTLPSTSGDCSSKAKLNKSKNGTMDGWVLQSLQSSINKTTLPSTSASHETDVPRLATSRELEHGPHLETPLETPREFEQTPSLSQARTSQHKNLKAAPAIIITHNRKEYQYTKPVVVPWEDFLCNLKKKLHFEETLAQAESQKEKDHVESVYQFLVRLGRLHYNDTGDQLRSDSIFATWVPRNIVGHKGGLYAAVYEGIEGQEFKARHDSKDDESDESDETDETENDNSEEREDDNGQHGDDKFLDMVAPIHDKRHHPGQKQKIGMSEVSVRVRTKQQPLKFAVMVMSIQECRGAIPANMLSQLDEMEAPGMACHATMHERCLNKKCEQSCEAILACSTKCATNTVGEQLLQLPDQGSRHANPDTYSFPKKAIEFMENIPNGSVLCAGSWETLPSCLQEKAKTSDYVRQKVRPVPPQGGFVTLNRCMKLFGPKYGGFKNAMGCPREKEIQPVVANLHELLTGVEIEDMDEATCAKIRSALGPIQGKNYSHFVRPTSKVQADGGVALLNALLETLPVTDMIWMERYMANAIDDIYPTWLSTVLDMKSGMDIISDNPRALFLVRAKSGHRVTITLSYFMAFAEKVTKAVRIEAVRAFNIYQHLLVASGNLSDEHATKSRKILRSFCMALNMDSTYCAARTWVFPPGYFLGSRKNVLTVSSRLGIGSNEAIYLHNELGPRQTNKLLIAHGLLMRGLQTSSPLGMSFECHGLPALAGIDAQPCTSSSKEKDGDSDDNDNSDDKDELKIMMVGVENPSHPLYGWYCCGNCHRKTERLERLFLEQSRDDGLSEEQKNRKAVLTERHANHPQETAASRAKAVDRDGLESVVAREIIKNTEYQSRKQKRLVEDPQYRKEESKKKKEQEAKRLAKGGPKKARGVFRICRDTSKRYDRFFMSLLARALETMILMYGQDELYANHIIQLFDTFLVREKDNLTVEVVFKAKANGEKAVEYLEHEYNRVCDRYLHKKVLSHRKILDEHIPSPAVMAKAQKKRAALKAKKGKDAWINDIVETVYRNQAKEANELNGDEN